MYVRFTPNKDYVILCYVVLYYAVLCYSVMCCVILCCAVLFCAVLCCVVLCCVVLCCVVLCCAVLCYAVIGLLILFVLINMFLKHIACISLMNVTPTANIGWNVIPSRTGWCISSIYFSQVIRETHFIDEHHS